MVKLLLNVLKICLILLSVPAAVLAESMRINYNAVNGSLTFCALLFFAVSVVLAVMLKRKKYETTGESVTDIESGLGNRTDFNYKFETVISDFSRTNYCLVYFIIDSNYLKAYHKDIPFSMVIEHSGEIFKNSINNYEFVSRITESGFAAALRCTDEAAAEFRVIEILHKLNSLFGIADDSIQSVYKASLYRMNQEDRNCEHLLFNLRRNCISILGTDKHYVVCEPDEMNSIQAEKEVVERIERGLREEEFKLYIQFIVDNKNNHVVFAEALSRWVSPEQGILLPGKYLGDMAKYGLVTEFDYYMFEQVCKQLEKWKNTEFEDISLSCNLTRITISESNFVSRITEICEKYSFDRKKLIMEVTEETVEKNRETALKNVGRCKELGFTVALDDFGSGYTSPANLSEYPLDIVKIDRGILLNTEKHRGKELFDGLIALAHSLNLKVVCEGVETENQNEYVRSTMCDFVQGWYFSKAAPVNAGEEFMRKFSQNGISTKYITG